MHVTRLETAPRAPQPRCSVNTAGRMETIIQLFAGLSASSPEDQFLDSASLGLLGPHCIQPAWGLAASTVARGAGWTAVPATSPGLHGSRRWRLSAPRPIAFHSPCLHQSLCLWTVLGSIWDVSLGPNLALCICSRSM